MFRYSAPDHATLHGHHVGRSVFGLVLVGGAAMLVQRLVTEHRLDAANLLVTTWCAALAAGLAAGFLARCSDRVRVSEGWFQASLVLPSIGLSLLGPLSVHLLFFAAAGETVGFDEWVQLSLVAVGLAHVGLAAMAGTRAARLASGDRPQSLVAIYFWTIGLSLIPFGFYLVPPGIVAVTGVPMLAMIGPIEWIAKRERRLAEGPAAPPRATVLRIAK